MFGKKSMDWIQVHIHKSKPKLKTQFNGVQEQECRKDIVVNKCNKTVPLSTFWIDIMYSLQPSYISVKQCAWVHLRNVNAFSGEQEPNTNLGTKMWKNNCSYEEKTCFPTTQLV